VQLPPELDERCRSSSRAAFALSRMRREREHHRIAELPMDRYINGLAGLAGVSLNEVQTSLGLPSWDNVTSATAPLIARVARLIGLPVGDAEKFVRWTYLGSINREQSDSILAMNRGLSMRTPLDESLHQNETLYNEQQGAELRQIVRAIRIEYTEVD
jgi:hypothetical protein